MSAGLDVEVAFDMNDVDERLGKLSHPDLSKMLEGIGAEVESQTRRRIQTDKIDPDGREWTPWSDRYSFTRHAGQSLLQSTGALLDSIEHQTSYDEVVVGSNLVYAATHQFGDPERNIIDRAFLGLSAEDEADVVRLMAQFLDETVSA